MQIANPRFPMPLVLLVLVLGLSQSSRAQEAPPAPPAEQEFDVAIHLESFDVVWQTVQKVHWDPQLNGVDWDAAVAEIRPQVEKAQSQAEVRKLTRSLLAKLKQSHYGIIPSQSYQAMTKLEKEGGDGSTGLTVRLINDELVVTQVRKDSGADVAGVKTGWVVVQVGDRTAEDILAKAEKATSHSTMRIETIVGLATASGGKLGDAKAITFLDEQNQKVEKEVILTKAGGNIAKFGHLPPFRVEFRAELLPDKIGYVGFNAFFDAPRVMKQYNTSIRQFEKETQGLVLDLRGNRGGLLAMTMGMCGWFVDEPISLGDMTLRSAPLKLKLNPRRPQYEGPVAVLIDECSISAAEVMSGGLKDIGAARVFGGCRSAGLVLPSSVIKLPNGDGFQFAMADYVSASGTILEGQGVEPDEQVHLNRAAFFGGRDPVMEKAILWIKKQNQQ